MKLKLTIMTGLVMILSLAFTTINAQSRVKILPSDEPGIMKILYTSDTEQSVEVKFLNEKGIIGSDRIEEGTYHHGFLKKYDVREIESKTIWLEVRNDDVVIRFTLNEAEDGLAFVPVTEKIRYKNTAGKNPVVASND